MSTRIPVTEVAGPELVPELFDAGAERPVTSGQFSAASLVGLVLLGVELLAAPAIFGVTLLVSMVTWWILDAPWAGRRQRSRRRGLTARLLYLSTLMLVGLWLAVMFIFRASEPTLGSGFTATLPTMMWGVDISMLQKLNGMQTLAQPRAAVAISTPDDSFPPFSLFVHGTASTIAVSLLAYSIASARRRLRRKLREHGIIAPRQDSPGSTTTLVG